MISQTKTHNFESLLQNAHIFLDSLNIHKGDPELSKEKFFERNKMKLRAEIAKRKAENKQYSTEESPQSKSVSLNNIIEISTSKLFLDRKNKKKQNVFSSPQISKKDAMKPGSFVTLPEISQFFDDFELSNSEESDKSRGNSLDFYCEKKENDKKICSPSRSKFAIRESLKEMALIPTTDSLK